MIRHIKREFHMDFDPFMVQFYLKDENGIVGVISFSSPYSNIRKKSSERIVRFEVIGTSNFDKIEKWYHSELDKKEPIINIFNKIYLFKSDKFMKTKTSYSAYEIVFESEEDLIELLENIS